MFSSIQKISLASIIMAIACFLTSPMAYAETTSEALTKFGMIGTWSPDCLKNPELDGSRSTYEISITGSVYIHSVSSSQVPPYGKETIKSLTEVLHAARVTEDKLRTRTLIIDSKIEVEKSGVPSQMIGPKETEGVIFKTGAKIRSMERHSIDGKEVLVKDGIVFVRCARGVPSCVVPNESNIEWRPTGIETPVLEKCLD